MVTMILRKEEFTMENLTNETKLNEILIRRKRRVLLPSSGEIRGTKISTASSNAKSIASTIISNMDSYGYTVDYESMQRLVFTQKSDVIKWWLSLEPALAAITGGNHVYTPMYPNFPTQVMEASDAELFFNAILHYCSNGEWLPEYLASNKAVFHLQDAKNHLVGVTPNMENKTSYIKDIIENLAKSNIAWSTQDKEDFIALCNYCKDYHYGMSYLDEIDISNKENLCVIVYLTRHYDILKTATDVLRYYTYISDGDVSLTENTHFKNISRTAANNILSCLERINPSSLIEDMWRYRERWIRIGERIHPNKYANKYPNVAEAFKSIRSGKKPLFFGGKVNNLIDLIRDGKYQYIPELVGTLIKRPGEYARRLDSILRVLPSGYAKDVIYGFSSVANQVAINVLFQVANHFRYRNEIDDRVVIPKGLVSKAVILENNLPRVRQEFCQDIVNICDKAIRTQLGQRPSLGKVCLGEDVLDFNDFNAPFALRSASSANKTVIRGSRLSLDPNASIIRLFVWWTNMKCDETNGYNGYHDTRVDVDLSMCIFDDKWQMLQKISYTNLRDSSIGCCHSGDITNGGEYGGNGAAEFIDIDTDKLIEGVPNAKYIAFNVNSFTKQTFDTFPCCFGWMYRDSLGNKGEIFDASTVEMRINMNVKSKVSVPAVYDVQERKIIWMDLAVDANAIAPVNIESNSSKIASAINSIINLKKTTMLDVITYNLCRAESLVVDRNEADIIFSLDTTLPTDEDGNIKEDVRIISPYDIDYFIGELM